MNPRKLVLWEALMTAKIVALPVTARMKEKLTNDVKASLQACFRSYPIQIVHPNQLLEQRLQFSYSIYRNQYESMELEIRAITADSEGVRFFTVDLPFNNGHSLKWNCVQNRWFLIDNPEHIIEGVVTLLSERKQRRLNF